MNLKAFSNHTQPFKHCVVADTAQLTEGLRTQSFDIVLP